MDEFTYSALLMMIFFALVHSLLIMSLFLAVIYVSFRSYVSVKLIKLYRQQAMENMVCCVSALTGLAALPACVHQLRKQAERYKTSVSNTS